MKGIAGIFENFPPPPPSKKKNYSIAANNYVPIVLGLQKTLSNYSDYYVLF